MLGHERLRRGGQRFQGVHIGGASDAAFGENCGDVASRGDVKSGMSGVDVGGDADILDVGDFFGGALFDGDVVAVGDGKIESGDGSSDIEGDIVFFASTAI